ncbi:MAG: M23 family metallopeptidase [Proteobacteria bacterium]|nr:M23 family metallopeptidase [Pseudomonadota bacterium]
MIRVLLSAFLASTLFFVGCATSSKRTQDNLVTVVVRKDDTLNSIARQFNTDWKSIVTLNRKQLEHGLREGQELRIKLNEPLKTLPKLDADATNMSVNSSVDDQGDDEELSFLDRKKRGLLFSPSTSEPANLIYPVEGSISSHFGKRGRKFHKGIDIVANVGTPIIASGDGEVIFSGRQHGYGSTVVVDHGQFMTLYAHASKLIAHLGDKVSQGDFIAKVGRTGNARGAHLHFEIRNSDNKPVDPELYLTHKTMAQIFFGSSVALANQ